MFWLYPKGFTMPNGIVKIRVKATIVTRQRRNFFFYDLSVDFRVQKTIILLRFKTPVRRNGKYSFSQQSLLRIFAIFKKRPLSTLNRISGTGLSNKHTGFQNYFCKIVIEPKLKIVSCSRVRCL